MKPRKKPKAKQAAEPKRGRGRPKGITAYRPEFVPWAAKAFEAGMTDFEVAQLLRVSEKTLNHWKLDHPEFLSALKTGKHVPDERVVRTLFHKATGYSYEAEEVFCQNGVVTRVPVVKHVPPDTTAMIFWLKNRRPAEWRDRHETQMNVSVSLAELVNLSFRPDLPEPKVIEHEPDESEK